MLHKPVSDALPGPRCHSPVAIADGATPADPGFTSLFDQLQAAHTPASPVAISPKDTHSASPEEKEDDSAPELALPPALPLVPVPTTPQAGAGSSSGQTRAFVTASDKPFPQGVASMPAGPKADQAGEGAPSAIRFSMAQAVVEGRLPDTGSGAAGSAMPGKPEQASLLAFASSPAANSMVRAVNLPAFSGRPATVPPAATAPQTEEMRNAPFPSIKPQATPPAIAAKPPAAAAPAPRLGTDPQGDMTEALTATMSGADHEVRGSGAERLAGTAQSTGPGTQMARHVAGQIAVAVTGQPGQTTDIALNPRELGRVRLSLTAVDSTITLTVIAERPETADLMRRHIDALAQEFRSLGYDQISFSFGGDGQSADRDDPAPSHVAIAADTDPPPEPQPQLPRKAGLDLRI